MSQPFIVVGDRIDHGGAVAGSVATTDINGLPVARINDKVACVATLIAASQIQFVNANGVKLTGVDYRPKLESGEILHCS